MKPIRINESKQMSLQLTELVDLSIFSDERGDFYRVADAKWGNAEIQQVSISRNAQAGTLRGMHALLREANEYKFVTCLQGSVFDVVIDLRPESPQYLLVQQFKLSGSFKQTLVIPPGAVHGYLTLEQNTEILYSMSAEYDSKLEFGIRWNDPLLGITWPQSPDIVSEKDSNYTLLNEFPKL